MKNNGRLAPWLKRKSGSGKIFEHTGKTLQNLEIQTICTNANCPNLGQCWSRGTATVLILGNICTRNCRFCSVAHGKPLPPDPTEPERISKLTDQMNIKYLVITSVDRDDLPDGGADHFKEVVNQTRKDNPQTKFELLVPDFKHCQQKAIDTLASALPFVFGHNVETVPQLYPKARTGGNYKTSLQLLEKFKKTHPHTPTKSSIMLGLGETDQQVENVLKDLRSVNCDRISIGQYLKPSKESLQVIEFIEPEKFQYWEKTAKQLGFKWVMSSPFTRSSFHAEKQQTDNQ